MVTVMKLSASLQCIKYLMFIFNLLFVITGIILLSIGAVIHGVYHNYQHFLDNKFFSVPSLLIAVGAIIFFIAFFGCCGAVRENYCMIVTFTSLLVLVFILELSGGISGYVLRSRASDVIKNKMIVSMSKYQNSTEISTVWDTMQQKFHCCGTTNYTEWYEYGHFSGLPASCCTIETGTIGNTSCDASSSNLHKRACFREIVSIIQSHAVQLGGVGIGIAFIQAIGIWFSIYLARSIRNSYENV